jgi:hypothetical protein
VDAYPLRARGISVDPKLGPWERKSGGEEEFRLLGFVPAWGSGLRGFTAQGADRS